MSWWCTATKAPWTWSWKPYPGVWLLFGGLLVAYLVSVRRHAAGAEQPDPRQGRRTLWFVLGIVVLWVASDWPIGLLGASYLASAHMAAYMLYTLVAAPLLLLGTPAWMFDAVADRLRLWPVLIRLSHPVVAGIVFNVVLIGGHSPVAVDTLRATQFGSFALDMLWLVSGLVLWIPICAPSPLLAGRSYPVKMIYLFLAAGGLPLIPGGFLTFASFPLYRTYELAPRVFDGLSAESDQQLAGAIMKVGNLPIVWPVIFVMFARWALVDGAPDRDPVTA